MGKRTSEGGPLGLFEGFGIEIEYMIARSGDLSVLPVADNLLRAVAGDYVSEIELGELAWSNELALHVIELKTNGPVPTLAGLDTVFSRDVNRINSALSPMAGRLMPTAMHPWMDPYKETRLWPHENSPIYKAFDRIFGCQGHGWSNLQSVHINLPFADDREFGKLHAAIRLLLPIMPALAASSPIVDGRVTSIMDKRLDVYRNNAQRVPSVTGLVVPEPAFTRHEYETQILDKVYRDLAPHDPAGELRYEWVNARGAIARFDRSAIEIRVLDTQECPRADLAIATAIVETIRALVDEAWCDMNRQRAWDTGVLHRLLLQTIAHADQAVISDRRYLESLGFPESGRCLASELWQHLIETIFSGRPEDSQPWQSAWDVMLGQGPLARRILKAVGKDPSRADIRAVYRRLCECLASGTMFVA